MNPSLFEKIHFLIPKPVGILGYGVEGRSTCRFLLKAGFDNLIVFDKKDPGSLPDGAHYAGEKEYLSKLSSVRSLFRSAGVRPDLKEILDFKTGGGFVTSQIELLFKLVLRENIIGITGTLGKGTCCSLLLKMLEEGGKGAVLGGNVGRAALEVIDEIDSKTLVILELSSFQLSTLRVSPGIAVVLKTTSEHLDWHSSREEYWDHKANLVRFQRRDDVTVYAEDAEGSCWIAQQSGGKLLGYGANSEIRINREDWYWRDLGLSLNEQGLLGRFNMENVAAAAVVAHTLGVPRDEILATAKSFKGLQHRLEYVGNRKEVAFYNDSYATRPEATMGALEVISHEPVGLIMGGSEKHADFSSLAKRIAGQDNIQAIALIGETAQRINQALEQNSFSVATEVKFCRDLKEALEFLLGKIQRGVILLSPACASFGLFTNYQQRGTMFKRLVQEKIDEAVSKG